VKGGCAWCTFNILLLLYLKQTALDLSEEGLERGGARLGQSSGVLTGLLGVGSLSSGNLLAGADVGDDGVTASDVGGLLLDGAALEGSGVGVEVDEGLVVGEGVLAVESGHVVLLGADVGLDFSGVDDASEIGVGDGSAGQDEAVLLGGDARLSKDGIEGVEGILSPDDEATDVATGGELEEVEAVHVGDLYASQVAEGGAELLLAGSDEEGSTALHEAASASLALSGAETARGLDALHIGVSLHGLEQRERLLGLRHIREIGRGEHKGDLGEIIHTVTTSHHQGGDGGRGERGHNGETALSLVHASVPAAPDLRGREHTSTTAHVTEGSLTTAVGTSSSNTGNTRHGTTSTPGLGRGLCSGITRHGMRLTSILRQVRVNSVHNINTDGGLEDGGQLNRGHGLSACALH